MRNEDSKYCELEHLDNSGQCRMAIRHMQHKPYTVTDYLIKIGAIKQKESKENDVS